MPSRRRQSAARQSLPAGEALADVIERAAGSRLGESTLREGSRRGGGGRSAATITAVAVTALAATAAYVWWRRHDGTRLGSLAGDAEARANRRWPEAPAAVAPPMAGALVSETAVLVAPPDVLVEAVDSTGVDGAAAAAPPAASEPGEATSGGMQTPDEDIQTAPALTELHQEAPIKEPAAADPTDGVEVGGDKLDTVETDTVETDTIEIDAGARRTRGDTTDESSPVGEGEVDAEDAAADNHTEDQMQDEVPAAASSEGGSEAQSRGIPRPAPRSSLDPSAGRPRPAGGRTAPRTGFPPLTQRFNVPSPRPRLPGSHRSPLP